MAECDLLQLPQLCSLTRSKNVRFGSEGRNRVADSNLHIASQEIDAEGMQNGYINDDALRGGGMDEITDSLRFCWLQILGHIEDALGVVTVISLPIQKDTDEVKPRAWSPSRSEVLQSRASK